jgi:hypothetical protein
MNRFTPGVFDERGIVAIGDAAFALGLTAGALICRTVTAPPPSSVSNRRPVGCDVRRTPTKPWIDQNLCVRSWPTGTSTKVAQEPRSSG